MVSDMPLTSMLRGKPFRQSHPSQEQIAWPVRCMVASQVATGGKSGGLEGRVAVGVGGIALG